MPLPTPPWPGQSQHWLSSAAPTEDVKIRTGFDTNTPTAALILSPKPPREPSIVRSPSPDIRYSTAVPESMTSTNFYPTVVKPTPLSIMNTGFMPLSTYYGSSRKKHPPPRQPPTLSSPVKVSTADPLFQRATSSKRKRASSVPLRPLYEREKPRNHRFESEVVNPVAREFPTQRTVVVHHYEKGKRKKWHDINPLAPGILACWAIAFYFMILLIADATKPVGNGATTMWWIGWASHVLILATMSAVLIYKENYSVG